MRSPVYFITRFLAITRTEGPWAAISSVPRKLVRRINRTALAEASWALHRVDQLAAEVARLSKLEDEVTRQRARLEDMSTRAATVDGLLAEAGGRLVSGLDGRLSALEGYRGELDTIWQVLWQHRRGLISLAELQGLESEAPPSAPVGSLLISVIMPTRNRVDLIQRAIRSLQTQTWAFWEVVVLDDGSTDSTAEVLAELSASDPRIRFISTPPIGEGLARNRAVLEARGEVITYLDDDNEYYPGYLSAVAAAYHADPGLEMAYTGQLWFGSMPETWVTFDPFSWQGLYDLSVSIDTNALSHRATLFHRLGGFDETLRKHGDLDLVLRYSAATTPRRIPVMGVRYHRDAPARVSEAESSAAAIHRIREKYATPSGEGLRVLYLTYDYPQLSESYVHTEIRWMQSRGVEIEVVSETAGVSPGAPLAPVHLEDLTAVAQRFRPHLIHVHWMSLAVKNSDRLATAGLPVTIRGHSFDHTADSVASIAGWSWLARAYLFGNLPTQGSADDPRFRAVGASFDASRFYPTLGNDPRLVLRTAACLPTKDLETFVEVAAMRPEYRYVLALSSNRAAGGIDERLRARNTALGDPVEFLVDVDYEEIGQLTRQAGVYLHTFGFAQQFGQPISIVEAMACGAVPLIRRSEPGRAYGGDAAIYYDNAAEASAILKEMLTWDEGRWQRARLACVEHAYTRHADTVVLQRILEDWLDLTARARGV